jgi:hypothetical protein
MDRLEIINATGELVKQVSSGSTTISDKKIKGSAENWVINYHNDLVNILSAYPKAVAACGYLAKSISNQRLSRKHWLKNLGIIKKALNNARLDDKKTLIFDPRKPFTAYQILRDLFSKTKKEVLIFDGYVEEGTLDILSVVPQKAKIKLLTNNTYGKFMRELPRFKREFHEFEARKSSVVHDRFFMIDGQCFVSGTSLHSLGGQKTSYIFEMDKGVSEILNRHFTNIWLGATKL